jgi:CHAT domain-containing protein
LPSELARSVRSFHRDGFGRLVFSDEEADFITGLAPRNSTLKATGFEASRQLVASGELGRYRIVHFATHGLINSEHPELSGLVLSLVDENGKPQDGFLRTHEIFNLQLPADLVVLSACQTALGKEIKGEGLVGLTRGFMYAGAERVVASLWQVDDQATSRLMRHFYRGMLKEGLRPAAALRAAQIEMSRSSRWSAPYYWAGFVIQGEWR